MPRLPSDYGGQSAGKIDIDDHGPTTFDKRVDAMKVLVGNFDKDITTDVSRRTQEELSQDAYDNSPYYGRWLLGLHKSLIERGHLSAEEISTRMKALKAD